MLSAAMLLLCVLAGWLSGALGFDGCVLYGDQEVL
jgi:hypothetical protein